MKIGKDIISLFKALSDPNRLELLMQLCKGGRSNVGPLCSCCNIDASVVSRHLSKLKGAGILEATKEGKEVFYEVKKEELANFLRELADEIEKPNCC